MSECVSARARHNAARGKNVYQRMCVCVYARGRGREGERQAQTIKQSKINTTAST